MKLETTFEMIPWCFFVLFGFYKARTLFLKCEESLLNIWLWCTMEDNQYWIVKVTTAPVFEYKHNECPHYALMVVASLPKGRRPAATVWTGSWNTTGVYKG